MPSPLPPTLSSLLSLQLKPLRTPSSIRQFSSTPLQLAAEAEAGYDKKMRELQARQLKMADKQGRMKTNVNAAMASKIPAFATYTRPGKSILNYSERYHNAPSGGLFRWMWQDVRQDWNTWYQSRQIGIPLGKDWKDSFLPRAIHCYGAANRAIAYGEFSPLESHATPSFVSAIRARRIKQFRNLNMDWKVHDGGKVTPEIVCVNQQEVSREKEFLGQVAVRFTSLQSLEVRDSQGKLIGSGRHDKPEKVVEYYVFARDLWRPLEDDWKILEQIGEVDPDNILGE